MASSAKKTMSKRGSLGNILAEKPKDFMTNATVENERLRTKVKALQAELAIEKDLEQSLEKARRELEASNRAREELQDKLFAVANEQTSQQEENDAAIRNAHEENEAVRRQMMQMEADFKAQLLERDQKIKQLEESKKMQNAKLNIQEARLEALDDVDAQRTQERNSRIETQRQNAKMHTEIKGQADYLLQVEDQMYKANKTSLQLLKDLKDSETELETLKSYVIDLKSKVAIYVPVKDDPVDMRLAEFINNYPDRQKLKIMFMREQEGVYSFGSKKILIKVKSNQIKIRVGGGFLSIDEFLDQYTPEELSKLERRDPLKRFSEKVILHKSSLSKPMAVPAGMTGDALGNPNNI